jgi:hypothetical protein
MADINIDLQIPVINGFAAIPDGQILQRTKLTPDEVLSLIPGSTLFRMGRGRGSNPSGSYNVQVYTETSRQQDQLWIQLPPYDPAVGPPDYYATLRAAAAAKP